LIDDVGKMFPDPVFSMAVAVLGSRIKPRGLVGDFLRRVERFSYPASGKFAAGREESFAISLLLLMREFP
jgi:hypothetical protein